MSGETLPRPLTLPAFHSSSALSPLCLSAHNQGISARLPALCSSLLPHTMCFLCVAPPLPITARLALPLFLPDRLSLPPRFIPVASLAGLQEARTEAGRLSTDGFTRFCSGAEKGQFGVELWFKTGHTVVSGCGHQTALVSFLPNAFTVLHADPRRIFVLFSSASIRILFASLHAPHRGAEAHILAGWWAETKRLLEKFASKGVAYLLGDFNAAVGSLTSRSVGDLSADIQDDPGDQLHDTLHRFSLWLPSTFQGVHFGPSGTYIQKRNQAESRNDYVAIPDYLDQCRIHSWVEPSIHAGQPVIDHIAALVSVQARIAAVSSNAPGRRAKVDVGFLNTPAGKEQAAHILESMPSIPWNVSPDAHAALITSHIQRGFEGSASSKPSRPRHPYLSPETWSLQKRVASLRRQLTRLRCALRFHEIAAAFASLRAGHGGPLRQMWCSGWTNRAILSIGCLGRSLSSTSKDLRAGCKADRAAYLSGLADSVDGGGHQAHDDLRRLLCRRKKRPFAPDVLPQLLDEQGALCEDGEATIARWRRHFSQLEGGVAMAPSAIAALAPPPAPVFPDIPFADFPAPSDLLCAILHAKTGKACGPDGIPAELGRSQPAALQQILLPLLLKTGLLCREPLGFKSGILTWLYKGRGPKVDCGSYRAIMLLSVVAKTFHRAFRPAIYRFFEQHSMPIQLGGKKNATVLFGSHISRAYGKWCAANSVSTAILYADVSAAYYSAVRALTARRDCADKHASFRHPDPEVQLQLEKPSALSQGGATEWLQALTHDLNDRTWMTLSTDDTPVLTTQGSRPGSSWADLFFGVTVPGILAVRDQMRKEAPKVAQAVVVGWDGWKGFFEPPPSVQPSSAQVTLDDVVWADDLASYLGIPCPEEAASLVGLEASLLNDSFRSYGYSLSFGVSKTAAIVQLRGPGARAARRKLFSIKGGIPILSETGPAENLPLVPVYKHLGVRVTANNSLLPEIKQRVAAAWVSFRQGKTKVFRSKRLSLERKGAILASHVLSKLTFGCGSWGPLRQGEMTLFARTVISMYRQCLGLAYADDQHVTTATICALVKQADPSTLLLTERLRYAIQLVANGPDALWALVKGDANFMSGMREAFTWLYGWIRATTQLPDPASDWEPWARLMTSRTGRFGGLIKRAKALETVRVASFAALQALLRSLCQIGGCSLVTARSDLDRPERYQDACLICRIAFPTRASWAVHAAKKHGYRAPATLLSQGLEKPLCLGCGRLYANHHRLRRHLLHSQPCRTGWGSFHPHGPVCGELHVQAPPVQVEGTECREVRPDPTYTHPGVIDALLALSPPDPDSVWHALLDFAEPLDVLQQSLRDWAAHPEAPPSACGLAEDACLLLDPELWCDDFRRGKRGVQGFAACAELQSPSDCKLNFVLTGVSAVFKVDDPPLPEFVYPFRHSVPLATARRHLDWLEQACDTFSTFLSTSQLSPVFLEASPRALSCLEPVTGWALGAGLARRPGGLGSPI